MVGRVLVAGSSGGIGAACMVAVRDAGGRPHGVDVDPGAGTDVDTGVDVAVRGGAEEAVGAAVRDLGGLDGVVHAVGMSGRRLGDGPVTSCTDEAWGEVLRVNLGSAFRLLRAALPVLSDGGSVVLVGSVLRTSTDDDFLTVAYSVSKGGLLSLARSAAREVAARGIRVNVVAPGLVDTPMAARALRADGAVAARLPELQPLGGRAVGAGEVAATCAFLLSDGAAAITGTEVRVDRGWTLR